MSLVRSGLGVYQNRRAEEKLTGMSGLAAAAEVFEHKNQARRAERVDFREWAERVPEPKSGTLDWHRFPYQPELYEQGAYDNDLIVKKSTQVGVSAFLVRWTMFHADVRGATALYVFPKAKQLLDFSDARIRPLILGSEYLRGRVPPVHVQNKGLKQIGLGFVYYRGSESKDDLDAVDADVLALDEYDTLKQANIPDAERRITGSLDGLIRRVGVPSIPDFGISALYGDSDRRHWLVKCEGCNEWQPITFDENVDQELVAIVCKDCRKRLDVRQGEWVPEFPDRDVRGYHIPRLIVPNVNLPNIIKASKATEPYKRQVFFNKDLGEDYAPESGRLSPQAIAGAQRDYYIDETGQAGYAGMNLVTMGVDVATTRPLSVRISEHLNNSEKKALFIGEVDSFDDLRRLMERFKVRMCAIDHLPEGRLAMGFAERFAGRVYLVHYVRSESGMDVLRVDDEQRKAAVRRVEAMDATMEMIRQQRNFLPQNFPENYAKELMSNVRFSEQDEVGRVTVEYRKTGPDDYIHAEVYDLIATELWWVRQQVEESQREVFSKLEDHMEFERSVLHDNDSDAYHEGPGDEDAYSEGFEGDAYSEGYDPDEVY